MQLGLAVRNLAKRHARVARLEEDGARVVPIELLAVEDVLEVEPGHDGNEQVGRLDRARAIQGRP